MSDHGKTQAKLDEAKGKAKETVGHAVGNERMEAEGRTDQAGADIRQAGHKAKDSAEAVFHSDD
jgi:uncharacterized protein YjbJ (UPF0337 family)